VDGFEADVLLLECPVDGFVDDELVIFSPLGFSVLVVVVVD
jgi:hypothetical protein